MGSQQRRHIRVIDGRKVLAGRGELKQDPATAMTDRKKSGNVKKGVHSLAEDLSDIAFVAGWPKDGKSISPYRHKSKNEEPVYTQEETWRNPKKNDRELTEPNSKYPIVRVRTKLKEATDLLREGTSNPEHLAILDKVDRETEVEIGMGRNREKLALIGEELGYSTLADSIRRI